MLVHEAREEEGAVPPVLAKDAEGGTLQQRGDYARPAPLSRAVQHQEAEEDASRAHPSTRLWLHVCVMFPNLSLLAISGHAEEAMLLSDADLEDGLKRCEALQCEAVRREESRGRERRLLEQEQEAREAAQKGGGGRSDGTPSRPSKQPKGRWKENFLTRALRAAWEEVSKKWPPEADAMTELYAPFDRFKQGVNWPIPPSHIESVIGTIIMSNCPKINSVMEKTTGDGFHVPGNRERDVLFFLPGEYPLTKERVAGWEADTWVTMLKRWFVIRELYAQVDGGSCGATRDGGGA